MTAAIGTSRTLVKRRKVVALLADPIRFSIRRQDSSFSASISAGENEGTSEDMPANHSSTSLRSSGVHCPCRYLLSRFRNSSGVFMHTIRQMSTRFTLNHLGRKYDGI